MSEEAPHELGVTDLRGQPGETGGDLRVEDRVRQAREWQQNLQILARGVHHLEHRGGGEYAGERREFPQGKRVDAGRDAPRRQLHQAQLRAIGTLAQKLRVEAYARLRGQMRGEFLERGAGGDDGLQTRCGDDLYNR